jgi:hypothetical protein
MNKNQINQTNMLQATMLILNSPENAAITGAIPAIVRAQNALEGSLNLLGALTRAQGNPLTGISLDKARLKRSLVNRALAVAGAAGALAHEAGNQTQAAAFLVTETSLITQRDALLDDTTQNIHDRAALLVAADPAKAAEYNLTPAALADLQSAITGYAAMLGTPRAAIATRVATTEAIAAEIDRAMDNLKRVLDRLIVPFESSHPSFAAAYQAARKIVNAGNSHAGPAATTAPAAGPSVG